MLLLPVLVSILPSLRPLARDGLRKRFSERAGTRGGAEGRAGIVVLEQDSSRHVAVLAVRADEHQVGAIVRVPCVVEAQVLASVLAQQIQDVRLLEDPTEDALARVVDTD